MNTQKLRWEVIRLSRPGHEDYEALGKLMCEHLGAFLEALRRMD